MTTRYAHPMLLLGLTLPTMLVGCQTYQPRQLKPSEHIEAWLARSVENTSLLAFIESLDEHTPHSSFNTSDGVDLHEAERVALFYNPDLRLARLQAGVDAADAEHAGLWDNPILDLDALRLTDDGNDPWIVGGSLSFTIPISGRLHAERQRADANARAALSRVAEAEWNTRIELRHSWHEWSAAHLRAQRTRALLESITTLAQSMAKLAEAGEIPATQAVLFEIERVSRQQTLSRHTANAMLAQQRLMALMGLSPDMDITLTPSITPDHSEQQPEIDRIIEQHPKLIRLRDEYAVSEAALLREIRAQYPDLTIGPAYESDRSDSRIGLVAGIPLPILNSNKQGIARARAERELARGAYETTLETHLSTLSTAQDLAEISRLLRIELETTLAPLVDKQLQDAQQLLELGESDALVLLESLRHAGLTADELIDARLQEARAITELESHIGPSTDDTPSDEPATSEVHE
ncbi:MAG: TolC family protein [Phycisphaerales bacterium]